MERPGGDTFRWTAPLLTRGPRVHGCDEAGVTKNKLSMGVALKHARGIELLMALWKISDVWMDSSAPPAGSGRVLRKLWDWFLARVAQQQGQRERAAPGKAK